MSRIPLLVIPLLFFVFFGSLGCASPAPAGASMPASVEPVVADDRVFPTVEAAVEAAFARSAHRPGPGERDRLRYGTIRRVEGGFVWSRPVASGAGVLSASTVRVRVAIGPDDVAIYGLHPRSGRPEIDRLYEGLIRSERKLLDRLEDGPDRPLYVLTPARRVLRYSRGPQPVELVWRSAAPVVVR